MRRERYEAQAAQLFAQSSRSADPNSAAKHALEQIELRAEEAEAWQASEERFLAQAVELMGRADYARQAAARASAERTRIEGQREREKKRLRKNARARERYRQRRLREPPRSNKRTGMHALAIEVDPIAYRAVKAEALRRGSPIPTVIGEILSDRPCDATHSAPTTGPRSRRTGEGRRAKQHTRIDIDDEAWRAVHFDALESGHTVGRWIGTTLEKWARRGRIEES